ncbi:MAG: hypothetical protein E6J20_20955, partial [Chloroflexi bacterium]
RFATAAARKRNEPALDAAIAAWTASLSPDDVAERLQSAGVVSAPLRSVREAVADPRLRGGGAFAEVDRVPQGRREYQAPLMAIDGVRVPVRRPAPRHAEHTDEVLADWAVPPADALPDSAGVDWMAPLAVGDPPLRGVGAVLRAGSDAAAVAARILADLGATVWRDATALAADARRHRGGQAYYGAGMRDAEPDGAVHIVIGDAATTASGAPVHLCVDDLAGGWRLDDLTACALSSLSWRIGDPGREPLEPGRGYPSAVAGSVAVATAIALLVDATRDPASAPPPRTARVSLLESALQVGPFDTVVLSFGGEPPPRSRRPWPTLVFACSDGWVGIFPGRGWSHGSPRTPGARSTRTPEPTASRSPWSAIRSTCSTWSSTGNAACSCRPRHQPVSRCCCRDCPSCSTVPASVRRACSPRSAQLSAETAPPRTTASTRPSWRSCSESPSSTIRPPSIT